jgi:hypothetical protein
VSASAHELKAAEHPCAWRGARDLLDLGLAIDRKQPHCAREDAGDIASIRSDVLNAA